MWIFFPSLRIFKGGLGAIYNSIIFSELVCYVLALFSSNTMGPSAVQRLAGGKDILW
jgi:hypothetical protein